MRVRPEKRPKLMITWPKLPQENCSWRAATKLCRMNRKGVNEVIASSPVLSRLKSGVSPGERDLRLEDPQPPKKRGINL